MSNVSNKAEKAKVASAVADVVKSTAAGVLGAEERAAKDSLSFIQKFKTDVLPLIERTATGKLNEDGPVFLSVRKIFDEECRNTQAKGSTYDEPFVLAANGDGVKVWTARAALASTADSVLDKLPQFHVTAALVFNESKQKFDPLIRAQIIDPVGARMANARRQSWNRVKQACQPAAKNGKSEKADWKAKTTADAKKHLALRKKEGHSVGSAKELVAALRVLWKVLGY